MTKEFKVRVKEIIPRTYNTRSVRFELPEPLDYKAGQFLAVTLNNDPNLKRYLSISTSPTETCYLEFTKKLTQSDFSKALDALRAGDLIRVQLPFGNFTLKEDYTKVGYISGGIGITPIRSMVKFAVDTNLGIDIVLIYSNRSVKDVVFREDFVAFQKVYPKLKVAHVLCEAEPGFKCTVGMINSTVIRNECPDFKERKFFLCGPPQMVEAMKKILREELNLPQENIITENFAGY